MKIGVLVCLGAALFSVSACSSSDSSSNDPVALCKELSATQCQKYYSCYSADELKASVDDVGTSQADCVKKFDAECTGEACNAGLTYHGDFARTCVDEYAKLSCSQVIALNDGTAAPPTACTKVCQ